MSFNRTLRKREIPGGDNYYDGDNDYDDYDDDDDYDDYDDYDDDDYDDYYYYHYHYYHDVDDDALHFSIPDNNLVFAKCIPLWKIVKP